MFLYSSRRRHTRWPRVWSSDVCSSDLAVITDTWVSMGQEGEDDRGERTFAPYQVTDELMELSGGIFLHWLPAYRGKEVSSSVIDGPASVVWDEAVNRLHAQKALLTWLLTSEDSDDRRECDAGAAPGGRRCPCHT